MARKPFVAGNWKLNLAPKDSAALAQALRAALVGAKADVAVFPTAISVATTLWALDGSGIEVGIQEVHTATTGAFTGANSPSLAREAGCTRALKGCRWLSAPRPGTACPGRSRRRSPA